MLALFGTSTVLLSGSFLPFFSSQSSRYLIALCPCPTFFHYRQTNALTMLAAERGFVSALSTLL